MSIDQIIYIEKYKKALHDFLLSNIDYQMWYRYNEQNFSTHLAMKSKACTCYKDKETRTNTLRWNKSKKILWREIS